MRKAFEVAYFRLEDRVAPSEALVEMRMEQLEDNDHKAESPSVVTTVMDVSEERLSAVIEKSGLVR
eukprot:15443502-Heterocapsa_arctica.AAC.1